MISPRKLAGLPEATRLRKIVRLIHAWELELAGENAASFEPAYAATVLGLLGPFGPQNANDSTVRAALAALAAPAPRHGLARALNSLRHTLLRSSGEAVAEWDLLPARDGPLQAAQPLLPIGVYAEDLRSPFNVGSVCRTALAYGAEALFLSEGCPRPDQARALRSGMGSAAWLAWRYVPLAEAARRFGGSCFALETGGTPLGDFRFPARGLVILGSEELGISPAARRLAESQGGIVSLELPGPKASLGVAVAFGVLMSHWTKALGGQPGELIY